MGIRILLLITALALLTVGCSSSPEEDLASDMCDVVSEFHSDRDEGSVLEVEEDLSNLLLQGRADGVDMDQVQAKLELDCVDDWAYFLNEQEKMSDLLQGILEDLQDDLGSG